MSAINSPSMPRRLPPGCSEDRDRHGNVRVYYRAKGRPKVRLHGTPWTPEFMAEYEVAKGIEFPTTDRSRSTLPGTWRWLCVHYFLNVLTTSASMDARNTSADKFSKAPLTSLLRRSRTGSFVTSRSER